MKKLPEWDYKPSPDAGLRLAALALVMMPALDAVGRYGMSHKVVTMTAVKDGVNWTLRGVPAWTNAVEIATPYAAVMALILLGRISRFDVGLTVGQLSVSLFWMTVGVAAIAALDLGVVVALIAWVRITGADVDPAWLDPTPLNAIEFLGPLLWSQCVVAPVREEVLFRGILVHALERIGGKGLAIIGSTLIWTAGHDLTTDRPLSEALAYAAFLIVSGMMLAWIFLKTRSLVVVALLHSVTNLFENVGNVILLCYPDLVRGLFVSS